MKAKFFKWLLPMLDLTRKIQPLEIAPEAASILCEETWSLRKQPANLHAADMPLFSHELNVLIPNSRLLALNQVNISSDGIIFSAGRILAESFNYRHEFIRWAKYRNLLKFFVRNYVLKTRQRLDDQAFWITDNWGSAYFHWLLDALPRLYLVRDRLVDSTLLLPESCRASLYVIPSLAPFGLKDIKFICPGEVCHCRKLLVPSHTAPSGNYNEGIVQGLRRLYTTYYSQRQKVSLSDKVYISRGKAHRRRIINEEDVISAVKEYGFSVVLLEDYPFGEQVKIMLGARYVVSNHGAGLANMLFLPEKGSVFELRKLGDSQSNCYFSLASALGLKYYYQLCQVQKPDDDGWADIFVDVGLFRRNLELMLAAG